MDLKSRKAYQEISSLTECEDERQSLFLAYLENHKCDLSKELFKIRLSEDIYLKGKSLFLLLISSNTESQWSETSLSIIYLTILGYNIYEISQVLECNELEVQQVLTSIVESRWYKLWHSNVIYLNTRDTALPMKRSGLQKSTFACTRRKARSQIPSQ